MRRCQSLNFRNFRGESVGCLMGKSNGCNIWNVSYEGSGTGFPCSDIGSGNDGGDGGYFGAGNSGDTGGASGESIGGGSDGDTGGLPPEPGPVIQPLPPQPQPSDYFDASIPETEGSPTFLPGVGSSGSEYKGCGRQLNLYGLRRAFRNREHRNELWDPLEMKVWDTRTGELKIGTGLRSVGPATSSGNLLIPMVWTLAADSIPAGRYRLEAQASDSTGHRTEWRQTSFTIE